MKYVPGLLAGQLSGSAGSTTASRNRFGSYFRTRNVPVNPNTSRQSDVRAQFASISQAWRTLTSAQRAGWAALGLQMTRQDSQGVTYTLDGSQAFQSVNRNLLTIGAAMLTSAPAYSEPTTLTALTITATSA